MERSFNMPISLDWDTEEVIKVMNFFELLEDVYRKGVARDTLLEQYRAFKKIVPSKSEEKQLFKTIDEESGISCFKAITSAQKAEGNQLIKLNK